MAETGTPEQIVRDFLAAWPRKKIDELVDYFADDAVYHNVPVAPIRGKTAIRAVFEGFLGAFSIELIVVNAAANGNVVFTERIDRFDLNGKRFDLPVNGVFELRGGKIVAFRDYFDLASFEEPSGLKL
ncbi:MAG TPA: limonene-1,2-epoxide hydrolase family protein [Myxococcota bacterium]|nr:limonene-1,2-epoxide hydrolase family protein [Myxococcota bacterium]